jgi:hypothetical protein
MSVGEAETLLEVAGEPLQVDILVIDGTHGRES